MRIGNRAADSLTRHAETTPLFTLDELRELYGHRSSDRSIRNVLYRLRRQGRVRMLASGVYSGTLSNLPLDRYSVPEKLRPDAVVAFHSALEFHGVANQVFQTVYYLSIRPRRNVTYQGVTYRRVAPPASTRPGPAHRFPSENRQQGPCDRSGTLFRRLPYVLGL